MKKVLLTRLIRPIGLEILKNEVEVTVAPDASEETILKMVGQFDALIARGSYITSKIIEQGKNLKCVATHSAGTDFVDIESATQRGIYVLSAPGANSQSVAEFVVGTMLAMSRKLIEADKILRIEKQFYNRDHLLGNDLKGKTIGIIGMGQIGQKIAKICGAGFDMNVIGYDPYQKDEMYERLGAKKAENIEQILVESDFVTLNCPLTPEVEGLIDKKRIELMKPTAYLINCARAPIVNNPDLIDALKSGRIAGAAIDVYLKEPPEKDDPLFDCPNLIATAHIAGNTADSTDALSKTVAIDTLRVLRGEKPYFLVNKSLWKE